MKFGKTRVFAMIIIVVGVAGFTLPERPVIPVAGAGENDWNHRTFWHSPWGPSGVHRGIDIFAASGTPAISATAGVVVFQGNLGRGGNTVLVLGPKWRVHYYAHLDSAAVHVGQWVSRTEPLGRVGNTGNAAGKPSHLHYSIVSLLPYPWLYEGGKQGWLRMFFLNPHERLLER